SYFRQLYHPDLVRDPAGQMDAIASWLGVSEFSFDVSEVRIDGNIKKTIRRSLMSDGPATVAEGKPRSDDVSPELAENHVSAGAANGIPGVREALQPRPHMRGEIQEGQLDQERGDLSGPGVATGLPGFRETLQPRPPTRMLQTGSPDAPFAGRYTYRRLG